MESTPQKEKTPFECISGVYWKMTITFNSQVGNKQVLYAVQDNSETEISLFHLFSKGKVISDVLASHYDFLFQPIYSQKQKQCTGFDITSFSLLNSWGWVSKA
jgi:hypothetical protein